MYGSYGVLIELEEKIPKHVIAANKVVTLCTLHNSYTVYQNYSDIR